METTETRPKRVCSPKYAVQKARSGKKLNRWEIEELAKDAEYASIYARKVLKGRFLEGEPTIAQHPAMALEYARDIVKGRFEIAEPYLLNDLQCGYRIRPIVSYFVKSGVANKAVEKYILDNEPSMAPEYAIKCLGGRWEKAEPRIIKATHVAHHYHRDVIKGRWPELEDHIVSMKKGNWIDDRKDALVNYLKVVTGPNPEFIEKLGRCNKANMLFIYAVYGTKGRLPGPLHQKMMMFSFDPKRQKSAKKYIKFLDRQEKRVLAYLSAMNEQERAEIMEKVRTN
jgi:hypothetical protein